MAAQNEILIRIQAELGDLKKDLNEVKSAVSQTTESAAGLKSLGTSLAGFAVGAFGVVQGLQAIKGAITSAVTTAAEFQTLQARLESLYGSAERGREVFAELSRVAATTPFELQDVVAAGVTLKSFGLEAENTTKAVADLAAFMGTTAAEAAGALGRAFAGGAGAADILRERGILNLVKSFQGIEDLTKLTLPEFRKVLLETLQNPVAGIAGSTDRLSRTFAGAMSNMKDSLALLGAEVGEGFLPLLTSMSRALTSAAEGAKSFFEELNGRGVDETILKMRELGIAMGPILRTELRKAKDELRTFQQDVFQGKTIGVDDFIQVDTGKSRISELERQIREVLNNIDQLWASAGKSIEAAGSEEQANILRNLARGVEEDQLRIVAAKEETIKKVQAQIDLLETIRLKEEDIFQLERDLEELRATGAIARNEQAAKTVEGLTEEQQKFAVLRAELARTWDELGRLDLAAPVVALKKAADDLAPSYREWVAQLREQLALQQVEAGNIERLIQDYPELAKELGIVSTVAKAGVSDIDALNLAFRSLLETAEVQGPILQAAFQGIGEALANTWAGIDDRWAVMLRAVLNTALDALRAQILIAKGWMTAEGIFNWASIVKNLPKFALLEGLFAAAKVSIGQIRGFEHGGVIDRPTLALMGEAVHRSGKEIVAPERSFKEWATETLLPLVGGRGLGDEDRELLRGVNTRLDRLGSRLPRAIGRELALAGRGVL